MPDPNLRERANEQEQEYLSPYQVSQPTAYYETLPSYTAHEAQIRAEICMQAGVDTIPPVSVSLPYCDLADGSTQVDDDNTQRDGRG